ncbi:MAG TPA: DUF1580 domain-containing protein [Urbifossiella sp.]|nr:DUF1580 domain-containing protein [Urbifossiella sp.]
MSPSKPDPPLTNLSAYCDRIPGARRNARTHPSTLTRWCTSGVKLRDGSRLRLRAVRVGSRWMTTETWFNEFVVALTAAHVAPAPAAGPRTPTERLKASRAADAELRSRGM